MVINQQADVVQLDLGPDIHGLLTRVELPLQTLGGFAHPHVIELDAFTLGAMLAMPVGGFEMVLGTNRFSTEQLVMAVKTIDHRFRNVAHMGGIETMGKHGAFKSAVFQARSRLATVATAVL